MQRRPWSEFEVAVLRKHYATTNTIDLAELFGRSLTTTYQQARKLGLAKSRAFIAELARERSSRPDHGGKANRFQSGVPAWNKGTKGLVGVQEACRATQFKKGRPATEARNYVPLGSHRLNADGYLDRKVTDDPSIAPARRWVGVHRLVWIEANGPIPDGHVVVFRPGLRTNVLAEITADRLECVTRADLARRNQYPTKELRQLAQLRGAITRQVNKRLKEQST